MLHWLHRLPRPAGRQRPAKKTPRVSMPQTKCQGMVSLMFNTQSKSSPALPSPHIYHAPQPLQFLQGPGPLLKERKTGPLGRRGALFHQSIYLCPSDLVLFMLSKQAQPVKPFLKAAESRHSQSYAGCNPYVKRFLLICTEIGPSISFQTQHSLNTFSANISLSIGQNPSG